VVRRQRCRPGDGHQRMRLELPNMNTKVDVFVGPNPNAAGALKTWDFTVDPSAQFLQVMVIGGGGGGGSGRVGATGTIRSGGHGGGGGGYGTGFYPAFMFTPGTVYPIWSGVGGAGAASVSDPDADGLTGGDGGSAYFADLVRVQGGIGGGRGENAYGSDVYQLGTGIDVPGVYSTPWPGGGGGVSANTGIWHDGETRLAGGGGGGGGWIDPVERGYEGGQGGWCPGLQTRTGFTPPGDDGASQPVNAPLPSSGGGGGGDGNTPGGGNGGNGGAYGGGGGGGGGATNGTPSGAGGNGADGIVVVISYF
jgi:hypothetical protein